MKLNYEETGWEVSLDKEAPFEWIPVLSCYEIDDHVEAAELACDYYQTDWELYDDDHPYTILVKSPRNIVVPVSIRIEYQPVFHGYRPV